MHTHTQTSVNKIHACAYLDVCVCFVMITVEVKGRFVRPGLSDFETGRCWGLIQRHTDYEFFLLIRQF